MKYMCAIREPVTVCRHPAKCTAQAKLSVACKHLAVLISTSWPKYKIQKCLLLKSSRKPPNTFVEPQMVRDVYIQTWKVQKHFVVQWLVLATVRSLALNLVQVGVPPPVMLKKRNTNVTARNGILKKKQDSSALQ